MTIMEATNNLIAWFEKHDYFNIDENYKALYPNRVSESKEADLAAVECALQELVKDNLLRYHNNEKSKHWVLIQPLNRISQTVSISYECGVLLSQISEQLSDLTGDSSILVKANDISERDILVIVSSLSSLLKKKIDN